MAVDEKVFQRNLIAVLSRACHQRGITTVQMGKQIGMTERGIHEYEHCLAPIPLLRLYAMAKVLKMSMATLLEEAEHSDDLFAEVADET